MRQQQFEQALRAIKARLDVGVAAFNARSPTVTLSVLELISTLADIDEIVDDVLADTSTKEQPK